MNNRGFRFRQRRAEEIAASRVTPEDIKQAVEDMSEGKSENIGVLGHDYGPLRSYEVTWVKGWKKEIVQGHNVLIDGRPYTWHDPDACRGMRISVHGQFGRNWRLVLSAQSQEIAVIRDVTEPEAPKQATLPRNHETTRARNMRPGEVAYVHYSALTADEDGKLWLNNHYDMTPDRTFGNTMRVENRADGIHVFAPKGRTWSRTTPWSEGNTPVAVLEEGKE